VDLPESAAGLGEQVEPALTLTGRIADHQQTGMKVVYAEVTKGLHKVLGAEVRVDFNCEDTNRTVYLSDNGANSDITAEDGIYSSYFVYTGSKRCRARLFASGDGQNAHLAMLGRISSVDQAPGVIFTRPAEKQVPTFTRETTLESFEMASASNGGESKDVLPPARINDLKVNSTSLAARSVVITFTQPGGDLDDYVDRGLSDAEKKDYNRVNYTIAVSGNMTALYRDFESVYILTSKDLIGDNDKLNSERPTKTQTFIFRIPDVVWEENVAGAAFAVAVRSVDRSNITSPVSNVVIAALRDPPTTFVPVFIAALVLIGFILLSTLTYLIRRAARKSASAQGKMYIHVPNLNKKTGKRKGSKEMDIESMPHLPTTSQVCVEAY
jgi:hypothetical protein